ncbi:hypothetical protein KIW84_011538 [Lathyrus oleraceus]|uniref:Uncharacterized protein n=1 Tax=Pisum sativum TaxID=3888 RepID=A0A9D5BF95_PEA|nr:hypothetical protein KIW84_011538 [Pisum sativum]
MAKHQKQGKDQDKELEFLCDDSDSEFEVPLPLTVTSRALYRLGDLTAGPAFRFTQWLHLKLACERDSGKLQCWILNQAPFSWDGLSSLHHTKHSSSNEQPEDEINKAREARVIHNASSKWQQIREATEKAREAATNSQNDEVVPLSHENLQKKKHQKLLAGDGETFISADDLRINLWNLEISNQSFNIVNVKPANMEDLTEVITSAEFHPTHCNTLAYSSSKGSIRLVDLRQSALCDSHAKLFEEQEAPGSRSFFTEIIASYLGYKICKGENSLKQLQPFPIKATWAKPCEASLTEQSTSSLNLPKNWVEAWDETTNQPT